MFRSLGHIFLLLIIVAAAAAQDPFPCQYIQKRSVPLKLAQPGALVTGSAGAAGTGLGASSNSAQTRHCTGAASSCGLSACTSKSTTTNSASGSGGVLGVGEGTGATNVQPQACPSFCDQCCAGFVG